MARSGIDIRPWKNGKCAARAESAQRTEMVPVMSNDEETLMIRETVAKFVDRELIPLEPHFLKSKATGTDRGGLTDEQTGRLRQVSKDLGL
jgi:hypothetical protein